MNIELLTLTEVNHVEGEAGNFSVTVRENPRYIDMDKCIACGVCAEKCPRWVKDEFNMGLGKRKAAYIKYGQSVPLKYAIDPDHCIFLKRGKCRACEKFCPTGAINFEDTVKHRTLHVGAVILATGFTPFDPSIYDFYGYTQIKDVVTSMDYERLLSASGPNMGHLIRPSDEQEPRSIAWIQCIGSRSQNRCDNPYCSSVCCMYAIKQALVTAEHLSGDNIFLTIFFMDLRSHGKDFERYYNDARDKGIRFIRARPHTIEPGAGDAGVQMRYTLESGKTVKEKFDIAVLSVGLEPSSDTKHLADIFGIQTDSHRFAKTSSFAPVSASRPGVLVTGAFQAPKAIPRSVAQASAAAACAAGMLNEVKGTRTRTKTYPDARDISAQKPAIGVFVCACGINIASVVDVTAVASYAASLPHVVLVENNLFTCSADTQELIAKKIQEHGLNRIVIAACTPRTHEPLFQATLKDARLNGYMVEMANIRNQNAWVHQKDPEQATRKAKDQVRMAVAKITHSTPLAQGRVKVNPRVLVIGGGVAGMTSALSMAQQGFHVVLVEKQAQLGGNARRLTHSFQGEKVRPMLDTLTASVSDHPMITVHTRAFLKTVSGSVGNFTGQIQVNSTESRIDFGAAILNTGGAEAVPEEYGYGSDSRIMTHLGFDETVMENSTDTLPDSVVFIQCVGSREPDRPYCSRICCVHSVKTAIALKTRNPGMRVSILYRDMRTYGQWEIYYQKAREIGVDFIRYDLENKPGVTVTPEEIEVLVTDPILNLPLAIAADYLVLASGVVPSDTRDLTAMFKCSVDSDGFLNEAHPKLKPVDMSVDGLFLAGMCSYPKPLEETIEQATAAASRAAGLLSKAYMELDAIKSFVTERCDGCALCLDVCPYNAISLHETTGPDHTMMRRVETDPALCKGCGICFATCPKEGIMVHGFTMNELKAQVTAAIQTFEPITQGVSNELAL